MLSLRTMIHLSHFHMSFKLCPSRNQALPFANIHKQQFPLLNYCVTGNLPSLVLVAMSQGGVLQHSVHFCIGTSWTTHHMMNFWGDMSRLKGWVVNGTGSGSCTLVDCFAHEEIAFDIHRIQGIWIPQHVWTWRQMKNSCPCHEWNPSQPFHTESASDQEKCFQQLMNEAMWTYSTHLLIAKYNHHQWTFVHYTWAWSIM